MTDFKLIKKTMYALPMDIRHLLSVLERDVFDNDDNVINQQPVTDQFIEQHIYMADSVIEGYLISVYSGVTILADEDAYYIGPVPAVENSSPGFLHGVTLGTGAITEQWLIKFTTDDNFNLLGSYSGDQGDGDIDTDFTATNSDIVIATADWDKNGSTHILTGNQFLLGTYISHPLIRTISAHLAAASVINAKYSASETGEATWAGTLYKKGMGLLKALADPKSETSLTSQQADDVANEAVSYIIDKYGRDQTDYGTFTDDELPYSE